MRVKTRVVQLHALSLPGYDLPTFSKGRLKTVYGRFGCVIRKYLRFTTVSVKLVGGEEVMIYHQDWTRVK